ncbi:MAG: MarR family winged helix-turn-helix transcriptional regulator [Promethearchaeota archaeon]
MKKDDFFNEFFIIFTKIIEKYFNPSIRHPQKLDLTKKGISLINYIGFRKQCFIKEIVERFKISYSTASEHIERLYYNDYIFKHFHKNDKRKVMVSLTDKGLLLYHQFRKENYQLFKDNFLRLDQKEAKDLIDNLKKFILN